MRVIVIGDIHGNLEAFQAVLAHATSQGPIQSLWCLGDVVGYGPDPGACLDLLDSHSPIAVAGNHDRAAVGLLALDTFNPQAAEACIWTAANISEAHKAYLRGLPLVRTDASFTLVHGSLRDPVWEYLVHEEAALATFRLLQTRHCLVAHSHLPFICRQRRERALFQRLPEGFPVPLGDGHVIVNPGSVGQPRDGDPRAAYIAIDTDEVSVTLYRVTYDVAATQEKMVRACLPQPLIDRLSVGR